MSLDCPSNQSQSLSLLPPHHNHQSNIQSNSVINFPSSSSSFSSASVSTSSIIKNDSSNLIQWKLRNSIKKLTQKGNHFNVDYYLNVNMHIPAVNYEICFPVNHHD